MDWYIKYVKSCQVRYWLHYDSAEHTHCDLGYNERGSTDCTVVQWRGAVAEHWAPSTEHVMLVIINAHFTLFRFAYSCRWRRDWRGIISSDNLRGGSIPRLLCYVGLILISRVCTRNQVQGNSFRDVCYGLCPFIGKRVHARTFLRGLSYIEIVAWRIGVNVEQIRSQKPCRGANATVLGSSLRAVGILRKAPLTKARVCITKVLIHLKVVGKMSLYALLSR